MIATRRWPAAEQGIGGAVAAGDLARQHAREGAVLGIAIEEDDRNARRIERPRHLDLARHDRRIDDRIDPVAQHGLDRRRLHLRIVQRLRHGDDVAGRPGRFAGTVDRDDRLGAGGDAVEDHRDLARPVAERGVAGDDLVADILSRLDDALARRLGDADAGGVVEDDRDGRLRARRKPGHVGHGDPLRPRAAAVAAALLGSWVRVFRLVSEASFHSRPDPPGAEVFFAASGRRARRWRRHSSPPAEPFFL